MAEQTSSMGVSTDRQRTRRGLLFALPALSAAGLGTVFYWGLRRNPGLLPAALIGKKVPQFSLPPVKGRTLGLARRDLIGEVSLVNVFASWCLACREEHPLLMRLAENGTVPVHGLNYKDAPDDAMRWLNALGDPYTRTGADRSGRVGIDWGVFGVPETYVVDADGRIMHRHVGPLKQSDLDNSLLPLIARSRQDMEVTR